MALSRAQKQILDKFNVSRDLQDWIAQEFNEHGEPKAPGAPDFLMVIADHLQAAETYLESQRVKLNRIQNPKQDTRTSPEEWQTILSAYEEVVKEAWERATGYWRIIDTVISKPDNYGVNLKRQHVAYAFQKKNLPLVEMLKWSNPEYFFIPNPPFIVRIWSGIWAFLGGIFSGMAGGFVWAKRHTSKQRPWLRGLLLIMQGLRGILTGMMMGAITSANLGYQFGKVALAIKMGFHAAAYNPFVEPVGSKHRMAIDLRIEEALFRLSLKENKNQLYSQKIEEKFSIRFAKEEDVTFILNIIKEVAAIEKRLSEVVATEATLKASLFGPDAKAEAILGLLDEKPVALAIYFHHYYNGLAKSGFFIEDLFIQKELRGYGLGQKMLSFLAALALKRGCQRIEGLISKQNNAAKDFCQKLGAKPMHDRTNYRVEGETLQKLAGQGSKMLRLKDEGNV